MQVTLANWRTAPFNRRAFHHVRELGIHGQNLFIDAANDVVIAKFSSQATPLDAPRMARTMRAVSQLRKFLA